MDQLLRDLLEQIADAAGVAEVEVQVVDEDQEDAAGGVVGRPRRRQDDAFLRRRRRRRGDVVDAAAVRQRERDDVLLDAVFVDFELVFLQVGDELPVLSRTITSVVTRSTPLRNWGVVRCSCGAGAAGSDPVSWRLLILRLSAATTEAVITSAATRTSRPESLGA